MFYSHSLLSRKSQLGTVWMAAHQQSRLQKSHVIVTDISHTVEQIMFPQAPLALRLSGNLLLGVTRIYSKKVDYLHDDWNKFFSQVILKLKPANTGITFQAVTLPDTFELDAMDFGKTVNLMESSDSHQKTFDNITLSDEDRVNEDIYISIHVPVGSNHSTPQSMRTRHCIAPTEDVLPPFSHDVDVAINSQLGNENVIPEPTFNEASPRLVENDAIVSPIETPIVRGCDIEMPNVGECEKLNDPISNENNFEDDSSSMHKHIADFNEEIYLSNPTTHQEMSLEIPNIGLSPGQQNSDIALLCSPVQRKRKILFEEVIVLSNAQFEEQRRDTSKLLCKRRKLPYKSLDLWKSEMDFQQLQMPLLSGMCENLKVACHVRFPVHPEVNNNEEIDCDINESVHDVIQDQPQFHCDTNLPEVDNIEEFDGVTGPTQISTQKGFLGDQPQFHGLNDNDSCNDNNGEQSPEKMRANSGFDGNLIQESPSGRIKDSSTIHSNSENFNMEFPNLTTPEIENNNLVEQHSRSSNPLDFCNDDDLNFLSEDSTITLQSTPARIGKNEVCTMSARARSVIKYLKNKQQANQSECLCLNSILKNQGRKQSARMFFDTLLLKTLGIIDVQQNEEYGPITILTEGTWSSKTKI